MGDMMVAAHPHGVLFAKNSGRDANEAQGLEWHPRRHYGAGDQVSCTWIDIPQVAETSAVLLSRPFWMWGAEMGANEHGLVVGNGALYTRRRKSRRGLTGMDLVRLALERATSAQQGVEVITRLIQQHGQGGGSRHERRGAACHNSFLLADPRGALLLETAGRHWAAEVVEGVRCVSNTLTIHPFDQQHTARFRTWLVAGRERQHRTWKAAQTATSPHDLMGLLRDHGTGSRRPQPLFRWLNGSLSVPCQHGGGVLANAVTTASWISQLTPDACRHWATATSAPCLGLFKPVQVDRPVDLGPEPRDRADDSLWWRHESFHRRVLAAPSGLSSHFFDERDALEERWLTHPPESSEAFSEADDLLARWDASLRPTEPDPRPRWTQRYWQHRNARANLDI